MNTLYKVVKIEGKDLGCVAVKDIKKGTLILQEKPECFANASEPSKIDVKRMLDSFHEMSTSDQQEFLKLHNRFESIEQLELTTTQKEWIESHTKSKNKVKSTVFI